MNCRHRDGMSHCSECCEEEMKPVFTRLASLEQQLREANENDRLKLVLVESNEVCVCGCDADQHENYGEDGEGCGNDSHECVRTCIAIRDKFTAAREALKGLVEAHRGIYKYGSVHPHYGEHLQQFKLAEAAGLVAIATAEKVLEDK